VYRARDRVLPALVHIQPVLEVFRAGEREQIAVTGSGVIFSADGHVLTNDHVVQRAERVLCTLSDQQEVPANVIGRDPWTDLAVLQLEMTDVEGKLTPATLGRSSDLQPGQYVMALGSPLGLSRSLSLGVISTVERYLPESPEPDAAVAGTFNTWIQTDAAINPGNSGGPLVNLSGEVVGINARAIPVVGENLGFAIPIDLVQEVVRQILAYGQVRRSWLGISWQPLTAALGAAPGSGGALIASVAADSAAAEAGVLPGDIALEIAGQAVVGRHEEQLPTLRRWLSDLPAGVEVDMVLQRGGERRAVKLTPRDLDSPEGTEREFREWGFTARDVTPERARRLRLEDRRGAVVSGVKPASFAFEAGLRPGDIVREMDSQEIPGLRVLEQRVQRLIEAKAPQVLLEVQRGRSRAFILLEPTYSPKPAAAGAGVPR
jgi:serine protease Do